MNHYIIGITGSSGSPIAERLLKHFAAMKSVRLSIVLSNFAKEVFKEESGVDIGGGLEGVKSYFNNNYNVESLWDFYDEKDMAAKISSGSNLNQGMVIVPCSMSTLGAIANGITINLVHRCASVMLKEHRRLVVVPRESPLSAIHLKNMLELSRLGVSVLPATMAFYNQPKSVEDMIDFVCMRILDTLRVKHCIRQRWREEGSDL